MNPEIKTKWVEALRSGRYQQGRDRLRSPDGKLFCCLGVLCDLVDPTKWGEYLCEDLCFLPPNIVEVAQTVVSDPRVTIEIEGFISSWSLAQVNDSGLSFDKIADLIEEQL